MRIEENILLRDFTTFQLGGYARYFATPSTIEEIIECLSFARSRNMRFFLLGGGSNIIVPDDGFSGLVIKPNINALNIDGSHVQVGATYDLQKLIHDTLDKGLVGLEFAAGIPGTVGGAVRGNAGTYGVDVGSVVIRITTVNPATLEREVFERASCDFRYRQSIFKINDCIIVQAELMLAPGDVAESRRVIDERIVVRHANHPREPSAGCMFKNIPFESIDIAALGAKDIDINRFATYKKIPAGYLIELLGLKGKTIGGAQVSPQHANYIINKGCATAENVTMLVSLIKQRVRDEYGIQLEEEVNLINNA